MSTLTSRPAIVTTDLTNDLLWNEQASGSKKMTLGQLYPRGYIQGGGITVATTDNLIVGKMTVDLNGITHEIAETNLEFNGQATEWYAGVISESTGILTFTDIDNVSAGRSGNKLDMDTIYDDDRKYCYDATYGRITFIVYFDGTNFGDIIEIPNRPKSFIKCTVSAGVTIVDTVPTIMQYNTIIVDVNSEVTTGAAWKITALRTFKYVISAGVFLNSAPDWAAGNTAVMDVYKNGVQLNRIFYKMLSAAFNPFSMALYGNGFPDTINKDDYLDITLTTTKGTNATSSVNTVINYFKFAEI